MQKLIANIHTVTCSSGKLSLALPEGHISPEFKIGEIFKAYDSSNVKIRFKVFNSLNEMEMKKASMAEHGKQLKLDEKYGTLKVEHGQRSYDLDDWFESTVKLIEKPINRNKRIKYPEKVTNEFSFNDFLESKSGKVLYLEITRI